MPGASDLEILKWVEQRHGFRPPAAWINYCRALWSLSGTTVSSSEPLEVCPPDKRIAIKQAFQYFGMLPPDR
jgi:hypothetical protein